MAVSLSVPALLALSSAPLFALQHGARAPIPIDDVAQALPTSAVIASDDDLVAVLFEDDAAQGVYVATGDGRGIEFGPPQRIDTDATGADKTVGIYPEAFDGVLQVRGDNVYALWRDERNAGGGGAGGIESTDLYFARSLDRGATWSVDQPVPKGHAPGGVSPVLDHAMAVSTDGRDVYVLQLVDPNFFGGSVLELWLATSHDFGATFGAPVRVAPSMVFAFSLGLAIAGENVHVAFNGRLSTSSSFSWDVFYARSADGGGTFDPLLQLDPSGDNLDLALDQVRVVRNGDVVAVAWMQDPTTALGTELHAAVSTDGGASFRPSAHVGADPAGPFYMWGFNAAIDDSGAVVLVWNDDRNGSLTELTAFSSRSADAGATWSTPQDLSGLAAGIPSISGFGNDLVVQWTRAGTLDLEGTFSRDGGATWSALPIAISGPNPWSPPTSPLQVPTLAFNARYDNALSAWLGKDPANPSEKRIFVGGYRLPEAVPAGFTSGGSAHVDLASFSGAAPFAWVVFAAAPGDLLLPFGDGRNLGLAYGPLMAVSLANPAVLLAPLAPDGSGSTAAFPMTLPPGFELHAAAVSLSLAPLVVLDEITDVTAIVVK